MGFFPGAPLPGSTFMTDLGLVVGDLAQQAMPTVFRNIVGRNGGLEVWQRGTSLSVAASTTAYTADGWYLATGANQASTVARVTGLTNGSQFGAQVQRNSGQTGAVSMYFAFPLDLGDDIFKLRGNKVVVSFVASTGANWSPSTGLITCNLYCGTGAAAKRGGSAYTGETNPLSFSNAIPTGSGNTAYVSAVSSTIATNITQAELQFTWQPTGTAGANDWISIDDVQLQVVSTNLTALTPLFERTDFKTDLERCLKHYCKSFPYGTAPAQNAGTNGVVAGFVQVTSGFVGVSLRYPVPMRATPTVTFYNPNNTNGNWRNETSAADSVAPGTLYGSEKSIFVFAATSTDGVNSALAIHFTADAGI